MTSKIRFLGDGAGGAYVQCYFSQLSSTSSALLGLLKPLPGAQSSPFGLRPHPYNDLSGSSPTAHQLLAKKQLVFLL